MGVLSKQRKKMCFYVIDKITSLRFLFTFKLLDSFFHSKTFPGELVPLLVRKKSQVQHQTVHDCQSATSHVDLFSFMLPTP